MREPTAEGPRTNASELPRRLYESVRRKARLPPIPADARWTPCSSPFTNLILSGDEPAPCEYAPTSSRQREQGRSPVQIPELRANLELGALPCATCARCAEWYQDDLVPPSLREYGDGRPSLYLTWDDGRPPLPLVARTWLGENAAHGPLVVLAPLQAGDQDLDDVLAELRVLAPRACIRWRTTPSRLAALGDRNHSPLDLDEIELVIDSRQSLVVPFDPDLGKLRAGTRRLATFVLEPGTWFDLEAIARASADWGAQLKLGLIAHGGEVPLDRLRTDDLTLVKDVVGSLWNRLGGAQRPKSLQEGAYEQLLAELRALLQRRIRATLAGSSQSTDAAGLPPLDHPWHTDADLRDWWHLALLGHGHSRTVVDWTVAHATEPDGDTLLHRSPWLRQLVMRVAAETRTPELLDALRRVYGSAKARKALIREDQAYTGTHDMSRFGGPWAEQLGLLHDRLRRRPFAIGKTLAGSGERADTTILIPSYRHGHFIAETLRSVLAQTHPDHRILVVDDCSPDDTVEQAKSVVDARIEVRTNPTNLGLGNSVLQALESVGTRYVALLNSDDLFHPERIERCREVLESDPDAALVTTDMHLIDGSGGQLTAANASLVVDGRQVYDWVHWYQRAKPATELESSHLFAALLERNFLVTSSNLFARTDWLRAQARALRSLKYCLDWQLFLEAALEGSLRHLDTPLLAYRLHASNTVWFREGRRWSYYLEVNRVAAEALRRYAERDRGDTQARIEHLTTAIAEHLLANRETDGFALFLHAAFDAIELDRMADESPRIRELVGILNEHAERIRDAVSRRDAVGGQGHERRDDLQRQLGELAREQLGQEQHQRRWLQGYAETLESRLQECWDGRRLLEADKRTIQQLQENSSRRIGELTPRLEQAERRVRELEAERNLAWGERDAARADAAARQAESESWRTDLAAARQDLEASRLERQALAAELAAARQDLRDLRGDLAASRGAAVAIEELRQLLVVELQQAREERDDHQRAHQVLTAALAEEQAALSERSAEVRELEALESGLRIELETHQRRLAEARQEIAHHSEQLATQEAALTSLQADRQRREDELASLHEMLSAERAKSAHLLDSKRGQQIQNADLADKLARLQQEHETLLRSREFRSGNFLWNRLPLAYMSRRGKKWYRRILDAKNRCLMVGSRLFRRSRKVQGTAVVTACWHWPIYSHTFVYQEMLGLTHMGLDVRLFHWAANDTDQLHAAFRHLDEHRTQLQPIWENHVRDKEHFEKTRPGRLRGFLERVAAATGRKVEDLEKEPLVLQGCTFARMAELAGANYLHSYFFYDQSFMAMQAAWLLDLPRGVSCYADHMLDDYPFKLVALHVELCDVVVATSARIKRELSQISGGRFDDKIVVKPNGVDGTRFPAVDRALRKPGEPFEVISVSRIEPKKGLIHLAEAIALLKERGHRVIAHIVGSKDPHSKGSLEYAAEFEARIAALGVQDQIVLHGMMKQEQLTPILQRSRAFVAPYVEVSSGDKDGIPTAMLEALASKLPVVTTDSGSILEVVRDGVEGFVTPQRDSAAFAAALQRLIEDPALEARMAGAARQRFDREFDILVTEKRLHERIRGFLNRKSAAR